MRRPKRETVPRRALPHEARPVRRQRLPGQFERINELLPLGLRLSTSHHHLASARTDPYPEVTLSTGCTGRDDRDTCTVN